MICETCNNQDARVLRYYTNSEKKLVCCCEECGGITSPTINDVYFKEPYFDPNLGNEKNPYGQHVESRGHKARIMKELGLRENGGRVHGGRIEYDPRVKERNQKISKFNLDGVL
jgi:hypothetical protein